jgi:response regulator NasT
MTNDTKSERLRILAADEQEATLRATDALLSGLGHEVTAYAVTVQEAAELIAREDPDLSVVGVDDDDAHAVDRIEVIGG